MLLVLFRRKYPHAFEFLTVVAHKLLAGITLNATIHSDSIHTTHGEDMALYTVMLGLEVALRDIGILLCRVAASHHPVADILDILSHKEGEHLSPVWRRAKTEDMADANAFVCRRCYLIEGCPRCAEKAKGALGAEICEFVREGAFFVVSRPMSGKEAEEALASTGLEAVFCLPVLD